MGACLRGIVGPQESLELEEYGGATGEPVITDGPKPENSGGVWQGSRCQLSSADDGDVAKRCIRPVRLGQSGFDNDNIFKETVVATSIIAAPGRGSSTFRLPHAVMHFAAFQGFH